LRDRPSDLDLVAFSPHPDDAELFCGGTMLLAAWAGLRTAIVDLSEGELSTNGDPVRRSAERTAASELLGLTERVSLGLPDGAIGSSPDHRDAVVQALRALRPTVVLAPYWEDRHPDHAAAGRLLREACFLAGVSKAGGGKTHRPERVYWYMLHHAFTPTLVVDVSPVREQRERLHAVYESQVGTNEGAAPTAINDGSFLAMLEARAAWFGALAGADRGEPFLVEGPLRVDLLPELERTAPLPRPRYQAYA
jgi:N-acetylglucosamine malate deacetylase 1